VPIILIGFHENPSCGSRVAPWGQADMKKLRVFFAILRMSLKTASFVAFAWHERLCERDMMQCETYYVPSLLFNGYRNSSLGLKQPKCEVTTHSYQVPRLRMDLKALLPLFLSMLWRGRNLPLPNLHIYCFFKILLQNRDRLFVDSTEISKIGRKRHMQ